MMRNSPRNVGHLSISFNFFDELRRLVPITMTLEAVRVDSPSSLPDIVR